MNMALEGLWWHRARGGIKHCRKKAVIYSLCLHYIVTS